MSINNSYNNNQIIRENLYIICKDKNQLSHNKCKIFIKKIKKTIIYCFSIDLGLNSINYANINYFFSGGRDGLIKLWKSNSDEKSLDGPVESTLKYNLVGHTDWINDLKFNNQNNILFSAGNDTNVFAWDLRKLEFLTDPNFNLDEKKEVKTILPYYCFNELNNDYVSCLEYNSCTNTLFTGGLDSKVCIYEIDKENKFKINISEKNIFKTVEDDKSVYSISANKNGTLVVCSAYENVSFYNEKKLIIYFNEFYLISIYQ